MSSLIKILLFVVLFTGCQSKELTLKKLKTAKWNNLITGISYISTQNEKGNAFESDSIELKIKGVSGKEIEPTEISFDKLTGEETKIVVSLLKLHLRNTKAGYVRINFPDMLRPAFYTGRIYLSDSEYDQPLSFSADSTILKNIPNILSARFISKEEAKKEYLADGNDDWKDIIDSNPLPNSIEIILAKKEWTEELLNDLKSTILSKLIMASDITFPTSLLKKSDDYYFFEYHIR